MKENRFTTPGEIRQFLVAFLTAVIVVTTYHTACAIIDYVQPHSKKTITIVNYCCESDSYETNAD